MPLHLTWSDIAIRLLCTVVAGVVIGFDRGEHGRPAGLRTTMLVALAACLAMIQVNALLAMAGRAANSFVTLDLMRLPLGILSGMGFIGAGVILRRDNLIIGVTTAATLWFVTVVGLLFGGGQIGLGCAGLVIGAVVLSGFRYVERRMKRQREGTLTIVSHASGPTEQEMRAGLLAEGYRLHSFAIAYSVAKETQKLTCRVRWRSSATDTGMPEFVRSLAARTGVAKIAWSPDAL